MSVTDNHNKGGTLRPANPDGKGVSGVMLDLYESMPLDVVAQPQRQLLAEYFTSMLALSARFQSRPAVGTDT